MKQELEQRLRNWRAPEVTVPMRFGTDLQDTLTPDQHKKLSGHLLRLLYLAEEERMRRNDAMEATETDLLGAIDPTGTECERKRKRLAKKDVSIPDAIYPFGWLSLQKFAAEVLSLVMPTEAPYAVAATAEEQGFATSMVRALRHQAAQFDHRNNVHAAVFDTIALDLGAIEYTWDSIAMASVGQSLAGSARTDPRDFSGPRLRALDPYNVSWDGGVDVADIALKGEFFAHFSVITPFELERLRPTQNHLDLDLEKAITKSCAAYGMPGESYSFGLTSELSRNQFYYRPEIAVTRDEILSQQGTNRTQTNHSGTFTGGRNTWDTVSPQYIHKTVMYVRLKPSVWGLRSKLTRAEAQNERFEVWEIHLIGEGYISFARPAIYGIDRMPVSVGTMNYRRGMGRSFRAGDHAAQMGLFASTILNMHKRAMRKGLEGGLTVYNAKVFDFAGLEDNGTGRLAARMQNFDDDIRRHIMQLNEQPDVKNSLADVERISAFMDNWFPSNSQPMMAGLDRATQYQAQAVMATSIRSLLLYAALVDGQHGAPMRFAVHHLNLLNAQDLTFVREDNHQLIQLKSEDIAKAEFQLVASQPLMGIDRMRAGNVLRDLTNITLQAGPQGLAPVPALLLQHLLQIETTTLDMDDYQQALQAQQERAQQMAAAEAGGTPQTATVGGGSGGAAQAQAASVAPGTPAAF